jgi:putative flippase GtrA
MSHFFGRAVDIAKREWKTVFRFGIVGGSSLLVKTGVYALLSRILWNDGPRLVQNILALCVSMIYNYLLHRFWTFRSQAPQNSSAPRYVMVVVAASLLDAFLFYIGHTVLEIYDFAVIVGAAFIGALFTFTAHRFFTFRGRPSKTNVDVIQSM